MNSWTALYLLITTVFIEMCIKTIELLKINDVFIISWFIFRLYLLVENISVQVQNQRMCASVIQISLRNPQELDWAFTVKLL